ncbi:MAG: DUF4388 domain-containing protein [Polyangiaceae bacterium]|nr:DUF4388 domain-containing protein [Polyangiaceae bacterium]
MARTVLVVEPDVDALGALASKLRALGLTVALADSEADVVQRARSARAEVLVLSDSLTDLPGLLAAIDSEPDLATVPRILLTRAHGVLPPPGVEVARHGDYDGIAQRVHALQGRAPAVPALRDDFRGELQQVSVLDLLQLLSMNRRTGVLAITTGAGAGEVRLDDGEVVDACFRRLEAEKALFRLLAERDGTFAFTSTPGGTPGRIQMPTRALLLDGLRQLDEIQLWRDKLGGDDDVLVTSMRPLPNDADNVRTTLQALVVPRTVNELLDEVMISDHAAFEAVQKLLDDGRVRRVPRGAARVPLGPPEQLPLIGALAGRLRATGYVGPARIVFAGSPRRLATMAHTVQRITDAQAPLEAVPTLPIPHALGVLRIGDSAELVVAALPTVEAYAPLWTLALAGSAAVIHLDDHTVGLLEDVCAVVGATVLEVPALIGEFDEAEPAQVANLIRTVLDALAGE